MGVSSGEDYSTLQMAISQWEVKGEKIPCLIKDTKQRALSRELK